MVRIAALFSRSQTGDILCQPAGGEAEADLWSCRLCISPSCADTELIRSWCSCWSSVDSYQTADCRSRKGSGCPLAQDMCCSCQLHSWILGNTSSLCENRVDFLQEIIFILSSLKRLIFSSSAKRRNPGNMV